MWLFKKFWWNEAEIRSRKVYSNLKSSIDQKILRLDFLTIKDNWQDIALKLKIKA